MTREPSAAPPDMPESRSIGLAFSFEHPKCAGDATLQSNVLSETKK